MSAVEDVARHEGHEGIEYFEKTGWRCDTCGVDIGESDEMDKKFTYDKVWILCQDWGAEGIIETSDCIGGEMTCERIAEECRIADCYLVTFIKLRARAHFSWGE